ncbi:MAG: TolB family protein [Planctomycetota bacterium]|jgi:hypothetical protein
MRSKSDLVLAAAVLVVLGLSGSAWAEWSDPVPVSEVNTEYDDQESFLSFDGLTLYFGRVNTDAFYWGRIYKATRPEPYGPFTSVEEISTLNYSSGHVNGPWVSPDNLRMYYWRSGPTAVRRLKVSERADVTDPWPVGSNISELNSLGNVVGGSSLTQDELIIVFTAKGIPGDIGGYDIYIADRPDMDSLFGNVRNLSEINTTSNEGGGMSPDGLMLYFHSDRNGAYQLFRATRGSLSEPFGNIKHLSIFDTPGGNSTHPCISSDGTTFYFSGSISGQPWDIYVSYLDSGPIAHWKFDEGSGSIAYDSAGDHDGTIYGADWTAGQINGALSFNGVDDYVNCKLCVSVV